MKQLTNSIALGALLSLLLATGPVALAADDDGGTFFDSLKEGKGSVGLRYRYETVSDDAVGDKDARASTLRTTLSYDTKAYKGFSLFVEVENVTVAGQEGLYNNAGAGGRNNGVRDRPVVADPEITEANQAFARFKTGKTTLKVGRQEITRGDHRFVGHVGWRQNHQSYDAATVETKFGKTGAFHYGYISKVNRIFGDRKEIDAHILDLVFGESKAAKFTLYTYLLDYQTARDFGLSTSTYGVELAGSPVIGKKAKFLYELELANQSDFGDNPSNVSANYYTGIFGGQARDLTFKVGIEVLEGDPDNGRFTTPLATLHKFNGWADKFLVTPPNGLQDLFLHLSGKHGAFRWAAIYHDFSADDGGADYGSEVDLLAAFKTPWKQEFGLKAALYDADTFAADTNKLMFWSSYKF